MPPTSECPNCGEFGRVWREKNYRMSSEHHEVWSFECEVCGCIWEKTFGGLRIIEEGKDMDFEEDDNDE